MTIDRRACLAVPIGLILAALVARADGAEPVRTLRATRAERAPVVDGKLQEPCWQAAEKATGFSVFGRAKTLAAEQTVGRVVYDDENLYVGVDCHEPRMDLVRAAAKLNPGTFVYQQGEVIELFVDTNRDRRTFFHIMANTNGSHRIHTTDEMQLENVPVGTAVCFRDDGFSMEIRVPFAVLHPQPNTRRTWGFNLNRARMILGQPGRIALQKVYSSWQNTGAGFLIPSRFGDLKIDADLSAYFYTVGLHERGGQLCLDVRNDTGATREVCLDVGLGKASRRRHTLHLAPGQHGTVPVPARATQLALAVQIRDARTGRLCYQGGTRRVEVGTADQQPTPLKPSQRGYAVFTRSWMQRGTYRSRPRAQETGKPLRMFAAPGEYEPATFAVHAARDLGPVGVAMADDLRSPTGATIARNRVDIRTVESFKRWLDLRRYTKTECYLFPYRPKPIPGGTTQRYWLTVHVPDDAVPGRYGSTVRVQPAGSEPTTVPVELEVLPLRLSKPDGMSFFMYFRYQGLPPERRTEGYTRKIYTDMREHGMTSVTMYAYPWSRTHGINLDRFDGTNLGMSVQLRLMRETGLVGKDTPVVWLGAEVYCTSVWITALKEAKRRGWPELIFYVVDEPCPGRYERVRAVMGKVAKFRKDRPDLPFRTTTAGASNPEVCHYYDVWIAGAGTVDEALLAKAKRMGKEVWTYDCGLGPVDAVTDRYYYGIWAWKAGIRGVSHWVYSGEPVGRFHMTPTWTQCEANLLEYTNTLSYVYPSADGPIPTIGWEAVREGIDDYKYLLTLKHTIAQAKRGNVDAKLVATAERVLSQINDVVHIANYGKARDRARERHGLRGCYYDREPPEPTLKPADHDRLRYGVGQQIIALRRALGLRYERTAKKARRDSRVTTRPQAAPAPVGPAKSRRAANATEALWDNCDDVTRRHPTYAQPIWDPKAFRACRVGRVAVSTKERIEGEGSIHWVVTPRDVAAQNTHHPKGSTIAIHKLYGRPWPDVEELRFHIKCRTPNHPIVYCLLYGNNHYPNRCILKRGEVTRGWREVRWDLRKVDIGTSNKHGRILWYLRFWTNTRHFKPGDGLDLYIDNIRLVTRTAPVDVTEASGE